MRLCDAFEESEIIILFNNIITAVSEEAAFFNLGKPVNLFQKSILKRADQRITGFAILDNYVITRFKKHGIISPRSINTIIPFI